MSLDPALLASLSATQARERLVGGECSVTDYALALLARVDAVDAQVQAWAHLDRAHVLAQAEAADEARAQGEPDGPLFGLPVGVKDIIDTADLPTEDGTVLHAGRMPREDAAVVRRLRAAGGWVMGKTVTTELATYAPGKTRNPHVPASGAVHTPGGSSSGSAAAVAAGMVPLAIGTQTNGSVVRPASFCGVYGFKPSAGLVPRTGVLTQSPPMDAVGVFGRTLDDVALLAEVLAGHDPQDPLTRLRAAPPLVRLAGADVPLPPTLGWVATPFWDRVAPDAQAAFDELLALLEGRVAPFDLPGSAADAVGWHRTVMEADLAGSFELEYERGREQLSASLRGQIERGRQVTAVDYRKALARVPVLLESLETVFDHYDALLTPATLGTAPAGLESTGDPLMCTLWTYLGMPALSLPLLHGENGLPLGVQLVGRRGDDARLLRTARWVVHAVAQATARPENPPLQPGKPQ
jgi:Asp-tRNA(Asn)/Glu-tRNA(Gln) amidotransferase A subunit family amidase